MEINRKDLIVILAAIPLSFAIAFGVAFIHPAKPVVHTSAQVVDPASTSTYLVTTTTATPKPVPVPAKPVKHVVRTTTTSEVPPRLTAEQELKIPGPEVKTANPDADEHMPSGTDWNLPDATS